MIPAKSRLPRDGFKAGGYRTLRTPYFSLKFKDNGEGINRIGVVVGKSVDNRAAQRNFLERQVKAQLLRALKVPKAGKDFLVIVFPKAKSLTKQKFTEELKTILSTLPK